MIISSPDAWFLSREIGGFSGISQGSGGIDHYTIFYGLFKFEVIERLNHIILAIPFKEIQSADEISDSNCLRLADEIVKKVIAFFPESEVEVVYRELKKLLRMIRTEMSFLSVSIID